MTYLDRNQSATQLHITFCPRLQRITAPSPATQHRHRRRPQAVMSGCRCPRGAPSPRGHVPSGARWRTPATDLAASSYIHHMRHLIRLEMRIRCICTGRNVAETNNRCRIGRAAFSMSQATCCGNGRTARHLPVGSFHPARASIASRASHCTFWRHELSQPVERHREMTTLSTIRASADERIQSGTQRSVRGSVGGSV